MSNFSSGFNPISFLYLNPDICVASNLGSIENVRDWSNVNYSNYSSAWINFDFLPSKLDETVFLSSSDLFDVSRLNCAIKEAMIVEGKSEQEIDRMATFKVPTISRAVYNIGSNILKFNLPGDATTYSINQSNLNVGDCIRLKKGNGIPYTTFVTEIVNSNTFRVNELSPPFDFNANYFLHGIKLYDPLRIASINFLNMFGSNGSGQSNIVNSNVGYSNHPDTYVNVNPDFNDQLYTILYPESRGLDREGAFVNYLAHFGNNDMRIANVDGLKSSVLGAGSQMTYERTRVNQVLDLNFNQETGRVIWNGLNLYYATDNPFRPLETVSPYYHGFITEWAIKKYINNLFWPVASFENLELVNLTTSNATIANIVGCDNLEVNNATFTNVNVTQDISVGGRFGIGMNSGFPISDAPYVSSCNVELNNMYVNETLFTNMIQVSDMVANTAVFGNSVYGTRFGVGFCNEVTQTLVDPEQSIIVSSIFATSNINALTINTPQITIGNGNADIFYVSDVATVSNLIVKNAFLENVNITGTYVIGQTSFNLLSGITTPSVRSDTIFSDTVACSNFHVIQDSVFDGHVVIGSPSFHGLIALNVQGLIQSENVDSSSDSKLKKNICYLDPSISHRDPTPLGKFDELKVAEYDYLHKDRRRIGFIAQDVEKSFPHAVYEAMGYSGKIDKYLEINQDGWINLEDEYNVSDKDMIVIDGGKYPIIAFNAINGETCVRISGMKNQYCFITSIIYSNVKMIDYSQIIALLVSEVQELKKCNCRSKD